MMMSQYSADDWLRLWTSIRTTIKEAWMTDLAYARTCLGRVSVGLKNGISFIRCMVREHTTAVATGALVFVIGLYVLTPVGVYADIDTRPEYLDDQTVALIVDSMQNQTRAYGSLPEAGDAPARRTYHIPITAYTSDPAQTDDTPCITASGLDVCERDLENVVAANFLPMGTQVRIPELFGNRVFYVEDRMNKRYNKKMDIWMRDIQDAREFGLQFATIEVF